MFNLVQIENKFRMKMCEMFGPNIVRTFFEQLIVSVTSK